MRGRHLCFRDLRTEGAAGEGTYGSGRRLQEPSSTQGRKCTEALGWRMRQGQAGGECGWVAWASVRKQRLPGTGPCAVECKDHTLVLEPILYLPWLLDQPLPAGEQETMGNWHH